MSATRIRASVMVLAGLFLASQTQADLIPTTIHSVSSNLGDNSGFNRRADYAVDGSGWFADTHSIDPEGTMWLNNGIFVDPNDLDPEIAFDLGEVHELTHMKVWNYNEVVPGVPDRDDELLGRGIRSADILIAGEDEDFILLYEELEFQRAPGIADVDFGEIIDLAGVPAHYVKIDVNSDGGTVANWGDFNSFIGLSEVQFFGTPLGGGLLCDLTGDGACSIEDIDQLIGAIIAGSTDTQFDLNSDGVVDLGDRDEWLSGAAAENGFGAPYLLGDFNLDGTIDGQDLNVIGIGWQQPASGWSDGDVDADGTTNVNDLNEVGLRWQESIPLAAAAPAVPEPSTWVMLSILTLPILIMRSRKRQLFFVFGSA